MSQVQMGQTQVAEVAQPAKVEFCEIADPQNHARLGPQRIGRLHEIIRQYVDAGVVPGAVLQVEQAGQIMVDIAHGHADKGSGAPLRRDALFRLYSMTKPVTSVAIMQLVEDGAISLDDPIAKYIPAFAEARVYGGQDQPQNWPLLRPITIGDLLRHSAGITYRTDPGAVGKIYAERGIPAGPGVDGPPSDGSQPIDNLTELSRRVASTPLKTQPGDAFTYGNSTDILGHIVEIVTGKKLGHVFAERIFKPLGMVDTAFVVPGQSHDRLPAAYVNLTPKTSGQSVLARMALDAIAEPRLILADPGGGASLFSQLPDIAYGGAGLVGTAADYLRFTRMIRSSGRLDGVQILRPQSIDLMRQNQLPHDVRQASTTLGGLGFGYGFAVKDRQVEGLEFFPDCGYFWGGAASTYFWIDPIGQSSGVLMTQVFGGDTTSLWAALLEEIYRPE